MHNELAEIETFVKVVDEGSLSGAARAMGCTPSTVSKLIKRMEDRVAVRLFYRTTRALSLTEEGKQIYQASRRVLDAMAEVTNLAATKSAKIEGVLRVHTLLTFAKYQMTPLLPTFLERYPGIRIEFILGPEPVDLVENNIDIAIHVGRPADSALIARPLTQSPWIICAAPSYLARAGTPTTPAQLANHNCLNFIPNSEWNHWPLQEETGLSYLHVQRGSVSTNQGEMMLEFARVGLGIVRLVHYHVERDLREGRLVALLSAYQDSRGSPIYLIYQARENLSPRVRCFIDFLCEQFDDRKSRNTVAGNASKSEM